uniref:Uncharacterized protein n=1 Tax=Tanacetum cinerariifolium TaxID=118510 RepID=A0A6L2JB90_TANCI|nr:hypothetical protein [Tanacetum cinerariifolium]
MDDPNITMKEYIRLEKEKAHRRGKVYNWETAKFGKIWYDEDVHDLRSIETKFPTIVLNESLTYEVTLSCEPTTLHTAYQAPLDMANHKACPWVWDTIDSEISGLKYELEKLKKEKESTQLKIENFNSASKSLDKLIESQISNNNKKGLGYESYHNVPPSPTGLFSPPKIDLSYSGLEEFQQPEFESYGPKSCKIESKNTSKNIPNELKESTEAKESFDVPLVKKLVSDDKLEKKAVILDAAKIEFVKAKQQEKMVRKPVKYAEMYREFRCYDYRKKRGFFQKYIFQVIRKRVNIKDHSFSPNCKIELFLFNSNYYNSSVKKGSSQNKRNFAIFFHFENNEIGMEGLRVSKDSFAYKEYDIRLMLAPRGKYHRLLHLELLGYFVETKVKYFDNIAIGHIMTMVKKSWGKESANEIGSKFILHFDSSFIEFVQPCFCFSDFEEFMNVVMRIGFGSTIKLVSFEESQVVTFNGKFVCGFRNNDYGTMSQSDNTVGSPHGFIIYWIVISKNIKKMTEVIDVENWRIYNYRVLRWIISLIKWNSSVSSMKSWI